MGVDAATTLPEPNKESLSSDLAKHISEKKLISVLYVDLDNFKEVNDQHGHLEGDKCLAEVFARLSSAVSGKGTIYRIGGDEFCALLPNCSSTEASVIAERMRLSVNALGSFGGTTKVTTSIGVVGTDVLSVTDSEKLIRAADTVMYISKWTTKNRVTTWPPSEADQQSAKDKRERAIDRQRLVSIEEKLQSLQSQQRQSTEKDEKERQKKSEVRHKLADFLSGGQEIADRIAYNNTQAATEKGQWEQRVGRYLSENLDQSYEVRFRNPSHEITLLPRGLLSTPMQEFWSNMKSKMAMLHDFISELGD
jgi:diguanylate cyclase (GGDEF)-like protein